MDVFLEYNKYDRLGERPAGAQRRGARRMIELRARPYEGKMHTLATVSIDMCLLIKWFGEQ